MQRPVFVVGILVVFAIVAIAAPTLFTDLSTHDASPEEPGPNTTIIQPTGGESGFYPYINPTPEFNTRSPINVVAIGDTEMIKQALVEAEDARWELTVGEHREADGATFGFRTESVGNESAEDGNETAMTDGDGHGANDDGIPASEINQTALNETLADGNVTVGTRNATIDAENGTIDGANVTVANETNATAGANRTATNETVDSEGVTIGGTRISWSRTTGATRYAYVEAREGEGEWITESMEIHDGTYYGERYHVRMYESPNPDEPWVAMQAHDEHFDWFTLRHQVHGVQDAQARMEADLMSTPQVEVPEDVQRVYLDNRRASDSDGWATFVQLAGVILIGGILGGRLLATNAFEQARNRIDEYLLDSEESTIARLQARVTVRHAVMSGVVFGLVLGVRRAGIMLEGTGWLTMHQIAALLYPFLVLGMPIGVYLVARGLHRRMEAGIVAGGSFALAVWLDFTMVGVDFVTIDVLFQRMLLVVALGSIAAGASRQESRLLRINVLLIGGFLGWLLVVGGTLFGYF